MADIPTDTPQEVIPTPAVENHEIPITETSFNMGAKPVALDIYKNIVGNPYSGSNPILKQHEQYDQSDYIKSLAASVQRKTSKLDNPGFEMRPFTYNGDYDGANFERYYGTNAYKTLGFSPYRDNETLYNNKLTLGDQFARATSQWPSLFKTGLVSGVKSWGDMFTDPLAPDVESAREMQRAMAIGSSGSGGVSGFLTNTFLNSAYTVGIGVEMLGETLLLAGATAATAGADIEATLPAWMTRMGMGASKIARGVEVGAEMAKAAEGTNEALKSFKGLKTVSDARSFWSTLPGKGLSAAIDIVNPLENTLKALKATDYASDYAKIVGTFGAFAKDAVMTHAAVSEAKLEGGMVKLDITKNLIDEYRNSHAGQDPEGDELLKIENIANQQALTTGLWNLPAIMWSNKFMYETMLAPIEKLVKPNATKLVTDQVFDNGVFKGVGEGFIDQAKVAAKSLTKPRIYGQYGMNYIKANLAEGVQENLQEAISSGAMKHAMDIYKDPGRASYEGHLGYFMRGLGEQFSAQGAETFAGGFVMGMFAQPMMSGPSMGITKVLDATLNKDKIAKYKIERDAQRAKDTESLNELYKNVNNAFAPDISNAVRQGHLSDDLYSAAKEGKHKEAVDAKDNSTFEHIYTALRTGHYDVFVNKLKDLKNLSPEEAEDAFKDSGVVKGEGAKALSQIDGIVQRAQKIKTNYENVANDFPNPYNPGQYSKSSPLYRANVLAYHAWEDAKKNLIFAHSSFERHGERMQKLATNLSKVANEIGKADAHSILSMLDPRSLQTEITTLKSEISVLNNGVGDQARSRKQKTKQLELLETFNNAIKEHGIHLLDQQRNEISQTPDKEVNKNYKLTDKTAKKAFKNYLQYLSKKNDTLVFDTAMDNAYKMVKDHMLLKEEKMNLTRNINVLSNPKGFLHLQHRMQLANTEMYDNMSSTLESNSKIFTMHKEASTAIDLMNRRFGVILTPEFAKDLGEAMRTDSIIPTPTEFIDPSTGEKITSGERFDKAIEAWKEHAKLIGKTPEEKAEETIPPVAKVEVNANDLTTFPEDLMEELNDQMNMIKAYEPDAKLEDLYKTDPAMIMLINKYITDHGGKGVLSTVNTNIAEDKTSDIETRRAQALTDADTITNNPVALKTLKAHINKKYDDELAALPKEEKVPVTKEETVEDINKNINSDTLKNAMKQGYEVVYDSLDNPDAGGRYLVKSVSKKYVILSRPGTTDIKVPIDSVSSVIKEIIKPGDIQTSTEAPVVIADNEKVVKNVEDEFKDISPEEAGNDFLSKFC